MFDGGGMRMLHPMTILIEFANVVRRFLGALIIFVILRMTRGDGDFSDLPLIAFGLFGVLAAVARYMSVRFGVVDNVLTIKSGIVYKQTRTIPIDRIQNINITRTVLHRLVGVADLKIETAAGAGAEAELSALGVEDAEALRKDLTQRKEPSATAIEFELPVEPDYTIYRASLRDLFFAGATQNRAGAVVGAAVGALFLFGQGGRFVPDLILRFEQWVGAAIAGWKIWIGVIFLLLLVGWIVSVVQTLVAYYGFRLELKDRRLHRAYGLTTQHEGMIPLGRVQFVRLIEPFIQRRLGYGQLSVETAGSINEKEAGGTALIAPIVPLEQSWSLAEQALDQPRLQPEEWKRPSIAAFYRGWIGGTFWIATMAAVATIWDRNVGLAFVGLSPFIALFLAWRSYRALGYARTEGFVLFRWGIWTRHTAIVPEAKIQTATAAQGPLQQKLNLASLSLTTAALGRGAVSIPDMPLEDALTYASDFAATADQSPLFAHDGV
jgi:putative membrane protein